MTALIPLLVGHMQVIFQHVLAGELLDVNTCTSDCPSSFTGWICAGNISECLIERIPGVNTFTLDCPGSFTGYTCAGRSLFNML